MNTSKIFYDINPETGLIEIYKPVYFNEAAARSLLRLANDPVSYLCFEDTSRYFECRGKHSKGSRCLTIIDPIKHSSIGRILSDQEGNIMCLMVENDFIDILKTFQGLS